MEQILFALKLFALLGSGLMAGVFFAFSSFVMGALARLQPAAGIAAMQAINLTVINPAFMVAFLGTAVACAWLTLFSLLRWPQPGTAYLLLGSLLYLVGTFLVTLLFNVPLNNALAAVEPSSPEGTSLWAKYLTLWTAWNHLRTVAALLSAAMLTLALCGLDGPWGKAAAVVHRP